MNVNSENNNLSSETGACQVMIKPVGPACNLSCRYCYYTQKCGADGSGSKEMMSEDLLELFFRQLFLSYSGECVSITWHGGEPLLRGIDFYKKAMELQRRYGDRRLVENSIQTNGVLVDENWCRFFHENRFLVGLSIDGLEHVHDRYRKDRSGKGTYSRVMRAMSLFQKHDVEFNTISTVNDYSSQYPLEIYRFLKESDVHFMQFIPVVECITCHSEGAQSRTIPPGARTGKPVAPWSAKPLDYGRFLVRIFEEWVTSDVGRYFVPFFDAVLGNWCGVDASLCVMAKECGKAVVLESDGSLYSCDHYVFPEYRLGNIKQKSFPELLHSGRQKRFGRSKHEQLTSDCRKCEYLFLCHGECPRNRFVVSPHEKFGHNYLCEGLKLFFRKTEPSMRYMRNELMNGRLAEGVMDWHRRLNSNVKAQVFSEHKG